MKVSHDVIMLGSFLLKNTLEHDLYYRGRFVAITISHDHVIIIHIVCSQYFNYFLDLVFSMKKHI